MQVDPVSKNVLTLNVAISNSIIGLGATSELSAGSSSFLDCCTGERRTIAHIYSDRHTYYCHIYSVD